MTDEEMYTTGKKTNKQITPNNNRDQAHPVFVLRS